MSKLLTAITLKKIGNNVALQLMREIKVENCPKCGERTYNAEHNICANCDNW